MPRATILTRSGSGPTSSGGTAWIESGRWPRCARRRTRFTSTPPSSRSTRSRIGSWPPPSGSSRSGVRKMGSRWLYCFTYWLARLVFFSYYRLRYYGFERLPPGPSIVVCNHIRAMDPPVLAALLPRPAWFMTKVELFQYWGLAPLIRALHAYPVKRGKPDRRALVETLRILKRGGIVLIFPEGHRSETGELQ